MLRFLSLPLSFFLSLEESNSFLFVEEQCIVEGKKDEFRDEMILEERV